MTDYGADNPYKTLGWHLKFAREQLKESLAEVSGAVEIDTETLQKIERGDERPSEDVLLLLISHFGLEDAEATSLWDLAGYSQAEDKETTNQQLGGQPMDLRIVYTDMLHVSVNDYGVVMNFLQSSGLGNQPLAVSRVGMSKEHARYMIEILQNSLNSKPQVKKSKLLQSPKKLKRQKTDKN